MYDTTQQYNHAAAVKCMEAAISMEAERLIFLTNPQHLKSPKHRISEDDTLENENLKANENINNINFRKNEYS